MDGTIDPDKIRIDGIETEEEKKKKEVISAKLCALFIRCH